MIRPMQPSELDRVAGIWLSVNLEAHAFIPAPYWHGNFAAVRQALALAEVYVYVDDDGIQGFAGLQDALLAGIFVRQAAQSRGIGRQLLDFVKARKPRLCLHVYQKNAGALRFYQRQAFVIQSQALDEATGETEYIMCWHA